jgi:hypothetical protein
MSDNERGFHHPRKVDKGIQRGLHDLNHVPPAEMPPGILSMTPLGAGKSSPFMPESARRPVGKSRD